MKISRDLTQFKNFKALFIVTGRQEADIYVAENGKIDKIEEIEIPNSKYSDKEGFFKTRTGGRVIRSGSVLEFPKEKIMKDFLRELKTAMKDIRQRHKFDSVYLFSPEFFHNQVFEALPKDFQKKTKETVFGDYCHSHPFEILKKIKKDAPEVILKEEAAKILKKKKS
ncbi:MAG: hypothetical protein A2365_03560 [Candidatus Nealsonbacteria bacterium RIFOXYB1_FULL_40_15]|uniref:Host attachment protein n=2 Tax=Candidatus Nealsoniibacteriota TaxID=1817911 RepID=A0A1G2ESM9_9BACT|nr:MAG: hypothetical protein A2365_03560 [Candidatus Nealsonbacteria bacterium RIFOXYB1_FULL_40_15]OGZ28381.1 MAG: hypothetical protein A2427_01240 [Candidatus Nealsonbacteria bacterium RIFOXYC1_FULL_40_7]OGZ29506.1 MAG: hypothetical protein A2562_02335 [Candidatus Nealsonbacteria bacterium RIFOXYD1_FULL_39_11]